MDLEKVHAELMEILYPSLMNLPTEDAILAEKSLKRFFEYGIFAAYTLGARDATNLANHQMLGPLKLDVDRILRNMEEYHIPTFRKKWTQLLPSQPKEQDPNE